VPCYVSWLQTNNPYQLWLGATWVCQSLSSCVTGRLIVNSSLTDIVDTSPPKEKKKFSATWGQWGGGHFHPGKNYPKYSHQCYGYHHYRPQPSELECILRREADHGAVNPTLSSSLSLSRRGPKICESICHRSMWWRFISIEYSKPCVSPEFCLLPAWSSPLPKLQYTRSKYKIVIYLHLTLLSALFSPATTIWVQVRWGWLTCLCN